VRIRVRIRVTVSVTLNYYVVTCTSRVYPLQPGIG